MDTSWITGELLTGYETVGTDGKKLYVSAVGRVGWNAIFTPFAGKDDAGNLKAPEFSIELLLAPGCTIDVMKPLIAAVAREKWNALVDDPDFRNGLRKPWRNQAERKDAKTGKLKEGSVPGAFFLRASAKEKYRPQVRDAANGGEILEPKLVYAGCWARIICAPFAYETRGNKGVSLGLRGVQKVRDDEPFTSFGGGDVSSAFRPVAGVAAARAAAIAWAATGGASASDDF